MAFQLLNSVNVHTVLELQMKIIDNTVGTGEERKIDSHFFLIPPNFSSPTLFYSLQEKKNPSVRGELRMRGKRKKD